jgi:hypothetical protein
MNTIPQAQAAHFCRLLLNDETGIYPLGYHARRILSSNDSLTAEQQFTSFIFYQDNWQTLRLFPHCQEDGTVIWYAPAEALPASLGTEHQKYIREVLPRLQQEMEAGHWQTVDAYIDRMLEYQCRFSQPATPNSTMAFGVAGIFLLITVILSLLIWRKPRNVSRG